MPIGYRLYSYSLYGHALRLARTCRARPSASAAPHSPCRARHRRKPCRSCPTGNSRRCSWRNDLPPHTESSRAQLTHLAVSHCLAGLALRSSARRAGHDLSDLLKISFKLNFKTSLRSLLESYPKSLRLSRPRRWHSPPLCLSSLQLKPLPRPGQGACTPAVHRGEDQLPVVALVSHLESLGALDFDLSRQGAVWHVQDSALGQPASRAPRPMADRMP